MLMELRKVRQVAGEDRRRWFFCHDLDLVVWEDEGGTITGFQLAYDRHRNEHSLSWQQDRGFAHYAVDDGEPRAGVDATPFLYPDGPFEQDRVLVQKGLNVRSDGAGKGPVDHPVDDHMGDMDAFGPDLTRQALGQLAQGRLGPGEGGKARASAG